MGNTTRKGCHPTILDRDTLMTEDDVFMTKLLIKDECECIHKDTCLAIIDLLDHGKYKEALGVLDTIYNQGEF